MRIALDARWMQLRPLGGVGRGLAQVVQRVGDEHDLHLLTDARWPRADAGRPEHALASPWPHHATVWLQWSAPRWLRGFDGIFHCPFYGLPYRQPVPMVVTLHDLSFEDHPEWFRPGRAATYRLQARHAARTARVIVTVSEHVRGHIAERYGVDPARIVVAPNGVDPLFGPDQSAQEHLRRLGVSGPYLVALGGGPRRHLPVAVQAWRRLVAAGVEVSLVVVGSAELPAERGLHLAGRVDDRTWACLLSAAELLLYPTEDEGFGMPALEAAASGTPVVCARRGALPEVLAGAAVWAESIAAESIAAAALDALTDETRRTAVRAAGLERARAAPGWDESAAAHLEAWRRAAQGG